MRSIEMPLIIRARRSASCAAYGRCPVPSSGPGAGYTGSGGMPGPRQSILEQDQGMSWLDPGDADSICPFVKE